jgi:plasmid stabilization system protein ParE
VKYRVHISDKAVADLDGVLSWFQSQLAAEASTRWFAAIWKAVGTLETNAERCSLAVESQDLGLDLRELLFGRRRGRYRILFEIRGNTVYILRVWHSARDALQPENL